MTKTPPSCSIPNSQLLVVTGKGGVGKTAVASAIATACARNGQRTLLAVYEREDTLHPLLNTTASYKPIETEDKLWLCRLDSRLSMKEYIHRNIPFHLLYDWALNSKMLGQFTDAAPGFDELMCLGKLYDLADGSDGRQAFDTIVFDAPATGHSALMLRTPSVIVNTVATGPIHQSAAKMADWLQDAQRCSVLVVSLAEEMALQEGSELLDYVNELGLDSGPMIVNRMRPQVYSKGEITKLTRESKQAQGNSLAIINSAIDYYQLAQMQRHYLQKFSDDTSMLEIPQVIQRKYEAAKMLDDMVAAVQPALRARL